MRIINVNTSDHAEMVDITRDIQNRVPTNMKDGICHVFSLHTTAGLTINENADPDVKSDIQAILDEIIPWNHSAYRHVEGNSAAHLKASLMGFSQTVPVVNGKLSLGTWQSVYFCEFDGPRSRQVHVQFIKEYNENKIQ